MQQLQFYFSVDKSILKFQLRELRANSRMARGPRGHCVSIAALGFLKDISTQHQRIVLSLRYCLKFITNESRWHL